MCHWKWQFKNGRYKKKEHCPEYNDTYVMGQYLMFCAHFRIPFSTGIGNCCYPSECPVHWLLTFSQGVEEFHQVCYLRKKSRTVFAVAGWSKRHAKEIFFPLNVQSEMVSLKCAKTQKTSCGMERKSHSEPFQYFSHDSHCHFFQMHISASSMLHVCWWCRFQTLSLTRILSLGKFLLQMHQHVCPKLTLLTHWHTQTPVRRSEPSMSFLLILAFCQ